MIEPVIPMSSRPVEKPPLSFAQAIRAGKRLRTRLTARQWIATVADKLPARPDLNAATIVRQAREAE